MLCSQCGEQLQLSNVMSDPAAALPRALNISLQLDAAALDRTTIENKFLAEKIRFGRPIEGSQALHKLLGLQSEDDLKAKVVGGEAAIVDEIEATAAACVDEYGWTDRDWLSYLRAARARDFSKIAPVPEVVGTPRRPEEAPEEAMRRPRSHE